jgi:hypothetical protein
MINERALAIGLALAGLLSACASAPRAAASPAAKPLAASTAQAAAPVAAKPSAKPASISAEALGLYRTMDEARAAPSDDELLVIDSAKQLIGMAPDSKVIVNGKQFTLDCIGTVCAIYYRLHIDLAKDFGKYPGNGVNRLYRSLEDWGVLHRDRYPRTGDIVIWDNTWDANGDGDRGNDPHTHAGIVLAVDDDGTIHYVHENLYKGVIVETMNLLAPGDSFDAEGKRINSSLAIATISGGPKPPHFLAGDVFQAFGDALKVKDKLLVAAELEAMLAAER